MTNEFCIAVVLAAPALTLLGLSGFKRLYGTEAWAKSRADKRRRGLMAVFWGLYILILSPVALLDTLSLVPIYPFLYFGLGSGVIGAGLLVCNWFEKPNAFRGTAAIITIGLVACLIWLTIDLK
ncbi:MAG: hypothetical protein LV481_13890 [Methylacidiphilales bacterium]|nr:hypothetical protein [Candidatus Methylacidiphilales bacterium]